MSTATSSRTKVLHVVAHLGGGVGRVLSRVAISRQANGSSYEDALVCLEAPEKPAVLNSLLAAGVAVVVQPSLAEIRCLVSDSDIVHVDWWPHPLTMQWLCGDELCCRLVIWSHTSGLNFPEIPVSLINLPHSFVFTTPVSRQVVSGAALRTRTAVVHSSGGFDDIPPVAARPAHQGLRFGYIGSLNYAKLATNIGAYLSAVDLEGFAVEFYGDTSENPQLVQQCQLEPLRSRLLFRGYTDRPAHALLYLDVFVYLLNPGHYGTTENALLEAMAAGTVPIVLKNQIECSIVQQGVTGLVVSSPQEFSQAVRMLANDEQMRKRMSDEAARQVREKYSLAKTVEGLDREYQVVREKAPVAFDFQPVFGRSPYEWMLSCMRKHAVLLESPDLRQERRQHPFLYDPRKSSPFHYLRYFPSDKRLQHVVEMLRQDQAAK